MWTLTFDRVPRDAIWWALRELGVEEHVVSVIQTMYSKASTGVKLGAGEGKEFEVKVGVHQGSVLSPLLLLLLLLGGTRRHAVRLGTARERQHRHRVLEQDHHGGRRHPEFGNSPGLTDWTTLQPVFHGLRLAATLRTHRVHSVVDYLVVGRELSTMPTPQLCKKDGLLP